MVEYAWPMALIVTASVLYQLCAKSVPTDVHPFAAVTATYVVAAIASATLYFVLSKGGNLMKELSHINWAPLLLGIVIVGLEVGWVFAYRAGWQANVAYIVHAAFVAGGLLLVGLLLFHEPVNASKLLGLAICLVGLWFINK